MFEQINFTVLDASFNIEHGNFEICWPLLYCEEMHSTVYKEGQTHYPASAFEKKFKATA